MCLHQTFPECGPEHQKKLKKMSPGTVTALFHWLVMTTMTDTFVQILHLLDHIVLPMHPPSLQVQGSGIPKRLRHLDVFESLAWVMWWSSVFARICGKEELAIRFGLQRLVVCAVDVCSISARNTVDIAWNLLTSVDSWTFSLVHLCCDAADAAFSSLRRRPIASQVPRKLRYRVDILKLNLKNGRTGKSLSAQHNRVQLHVFSRNLAHSSVDRRLQALLSPVV